MKAFLAEAAALLGCWPIWLPGPIWGASWQKFMGFDGSLSLQREPDHFLDPMLNLDGRERESLISGMKCTSSRNGSFQGECPYNGMLPFSL